MKKQTVGFIDKEFEFQFWKTRQIDSKSVERNFGNAIVSVIVNLRLSSPHTRKWRRNVVSRTDLYETGADYGHLIPKQMRL